MHTWGGFASRRSASAGVHTLGAIGALRVLGVTDCDRNVRRAHGHASRMVRPKSFETHKRTLRNRCGAARRTTTPRLTHYKLRKGPTDWRPITLDRVVTASHEVYVIDTSRIRGQPIAGWVVRQGSTVRHPLLCHYRMRRSTLTWACFDRNERAPIPMQG